jgi:hypothetical protein
MLDSLSHRLLTLLQFTRAALVFTAISNSLCSLLLARRFEKPLDQPLDVLGDWHVPLLAAVVSAGLYGFGMSLNDIIDRRRDQQTAAHRPLPSGRIHLATAHLVCGFCIMAAIIAGILYAQFTSPTPGWRSFVLLVLTALLISFYDLAGKYLVALGLVTLGLIRFVHALIPAGYVPLPAHAVLLFTHVALLSAVAYAWEQKRPTLTGAHWWTVIGLVLVVNVLALTLAGRVNLRTVAPGEAAPAGAPIDIRLLVPAGLALAFLATAVLIRKRSATPRQAGQALMLTGLLWLIVYDAGFAAVYVGMKYAGFLLLLLPLSYLIVWLIRWWSKLVLLSQQPAYKRVRSQANQSDA